MPTDVKLNADGVADERLSEILAGCEGVPDKYPEPNWPLGVDTKIATKIMVHIARLDPTTVAAIVTDDAITTLSRLTPPKQDDARDSTVGAEPVGWISDYDILGMVELGIDRAIIASERIAGFTTPLYTADALASARADGVREGLEQAAKWHEAQPYRYGDEHGESAAAIRAMINK